MTDDEKSIESEDTTSVDDIFSDQADSEEMEPESKVEPETKEEKSSEEEGENQDTDDNKTEVKAETESKDSDKGDEKQDSTGEPPSSEKEDWTKTAVLDERRKRQDLEKVVKELEDKFAAKEQKQEKVERPDPIEDPEGAMNHDNQNHTQELWKVKVDLSRDIMLDKHDDYHEMEKKFIELAKDDQFLAQKFRTVSNPAKFAYQTAKNHIDSQNFNDPNYKEKLKAEMKKEILAELVNNQKTKSDDKSNVVVPNLTNKTSVASNVLQKEEYKGTLDEYFDDEFES